MTMKKDYFADSRHVARICVVQMIYSGLVRGENAIYIDKELGSSVIKTFHHGDADSIELFQDMKKVHKKTFASLWEYYQEFEENIINTTSSIVQKKRDWQQLEYLIQSILLGAATEMMQSSDRPVSIIMNEYLNITRHFFDEASVKFMNGMLQEIVTFLKEE